MTKQEQRTVVTDEQGWIIYAGDARINPKYWRGLTIKQQDNLMRVTYEEEILSQRALGTMQREYYTDYRADGDSHDEAMEKACLI